jgi:hypothetical protein
MGVARDLHKKHFLQRMKNLGVVCKGSVDRPSRSSSLVASDDCE